MKTFTHTTRISSNNHYDEVFIQSLNDDLESLGFKTHIVLPEAKLKNKSNKSSEYEKLDYPKKKLTIKEYLNARRDYASLLFVATKLSTSETVRILFNNIGQTYIYKEDDLPSKLDSNQSASAHLISVTSRDPIKSFTSVAYYMARFKTPTPAKTRITLVLALIGTIWLFIEVIYITKFGQVFLLRQHLQPNISLDFVLMLLSFVSILPVFKLEKPGLRIEPKQQRIKPFLGGLLKGHFTNNPVLVLILAILGAFIGGLILEIVSTLLHLGH